MPRRHQPLPTTTRPAANPAAASPALLLLAVLFLLALPLPARAADSIWWEAENPTSTNFPAQNPFAPANAKEADALSGGKWIGVAQDRDHTLFLEYNITTPRAATYHFYARKFWQHGPFRWRFDDQPWQTCGKDVALLDSVSLRQFVSANWVSLGDAPLSPGTHLLRIELLENKGAAAFDCFLLTTRPFTPRGKLKPGEKLGRAPEGWFPFEPDPDAFNPSPIDLRPLNEAAAGDHGFIQVRGPDFIHSQTGQPERFWGVNAGPGVTDADNATLDRLARALAKRGVNLVRLHGALWKSDDLTTLDPRRLDRVFYFIAALKRQGIYTSLSIYFPLWLKFQHPALGYTGQTPFALLFFDQAFQHTYRGWWRTLLTTTNPYTGLTLAQDPAVAFAELVNEDSLFFWTFKPYDSIPAPATELLEHQFGQWLAQRDGSVEKSLARWGGRALKGDDAAAGRAGFLPLWQIFNDKSPRGQDTARFLTLRQRDFFAQTTAFLKHDLGFQGSIYGSNWITASDSILGPLDKYSNTACDFMDRHGYFGGLHQGPRAGYALSAGDTYSDRSALFLDNPDAKPGTPGAIPGAAPALPIMDVIYNDKPSITTEINWPMPNRFRAEMPLLSAAYGSLQGTNAFCFFALTAPDWQSEEDKFGIQSPVGLGQFPAAALIYRRGLVKRSEPVIHAELRLDDLFALQGSPVARAQNLDELRARDIPAGQANASSRPAVAAIDPLSFLVGRVELAFSEKPGPSRTADLTRFIDRAHHRVRSTTGELTWDYATGLVTLDAPAAQGATGFLAKAGPIKLSQLTIDSPMEYGAILLVALDGQPLATSKKMLLQVMSEEANYGWSTTDAGPAPGAAPGAAPAPGTATAAGAQGGTRKIRDLGGPPIVVRNLAGTITLRRPDAGTLHFTRLDANGYPTRPAGTAALITLAPDTLYYLIASE